MSVMDTHDCNEVHDAKATLVPAPAAASAAPAAPVASVTSAASAPRASKAQPSAHASQAPATLLHATDVVVITGMSGSGRTQAMHVFEDLGYYCIDNLPPRLILSLAEMIAIPSVSDRHLAVTCDLRSQGLFDDLSDAIKDLRAHELKVSLLFLDSSDEVLVQRYSETRRRHPLAGRKESLTHTIARERVQLETVKTMADCVIDTSHLHPRDLRLRIHQEFFDTSVESMMDVNVFSFGYKYGAPREADLMMDVRFLPNPFYDKAMRALTGKDEAVRSFVLEHAVTKKFLKAWFALLDCVMPGYITEGKTHLSIAIGCTGGQHRSVAIAEATAHYLSQHSYKTLLSHRDLHFAYARNAEHMHDSNS